ncbi:MAG: hypothetical protein U9Q82_09485, partial [Chloroflexota bacterium]|nr:hypothetical protein [Chloroflexota bacterium]
GRVQAGSITFVAMMTVACIGAVIVGGTQGALPVILVIPLAAAGITLGGNASMVLSILSLATLISVGLMERSGIISVSYSSPETTILLNMVDVGFGLVFVTLSIWLAGYSLRQSLGRTKQAASEADHYRREAEKSLIMEQATRDHLQQAIEQYATFLNQISRGDYETRLSLTTEDQSLATLEQQLNETVDALVSALKESENARKEVDLTHRRYLIQAWREYLGTKIAKEYKISDPDGKITDKNLLATLETALNQRHTITSQNNLPESKQASDIAIPITLRNEIVGILGLRREGKRPWNADEHALIETITERLALSMESMRLLEETQNTAARERVIGEASTRMRETLDIESVLQTAAQELHKALGQVETEVWISAE